MKSFYYPEEEPSDDDPPSGPPLSQEDRTALVATIVRMLWRIISITTQRGSKPLESIGLYLRDIKYVYYAIHPSDRGFVRIEGIRHDVDGPLHERTFRHLTDEQLRELHTIVAYELEQLTRPS